MTLAIVKVLPEPVTPSRVCLEMPEFSPETSLSMAWGWSPAGFMSDSRWKFTLLFYQVSGSFRVVKYCIMYRCQEGQ